jgi:hypothetical protein
MMVARQFIAWNSCENGNRPVGYKLPGYDHLVPNGTAPANTAGHLLPIGCGPWLELGSFRSLASDAYSDSARAEARSASILFRQ